MRFFSDTSSNYAGPEAGQVRLCAEGVLYAGAFWCHCHNALVHPWALIAALVLDTPTIPAVRFHNVQDTPCLELCLEVLLVVLYLCRNGECVWSAVGMSTRARGRTVMGQIPPQGRLRNLWRASGTKGAPLCHTPHP